MSATASKVSKPWNSIKLHKKLKLVCKKLKPVKQLLNMFSRIMGKLFTPTVYLQREQACYEEDTWTQEELAFVTVVVKVNPRKRGWQRAIRSLLNKCQGARFSMNQDGVVQISGITNPTRLLNRIGRWRRLELQWFQFGQCCSDLVYKPRPAASESDNKLANGHSMVAANVPPLAPYVTQYPSTRPFNPYAQPYSYKYYY